MLKLGPGTITEGTLRVEDLLAAYISALENAIDPDDLSRDAESARAFLVEANAFYRRCDVHNDNDLQQAYFLLDDLSNRISECAPEGFYFGAHEGDGALIGIWPVEDDTQ